MVCVTDHNLTAAAVSAAAAADRGELDLRIIVGEEIRTPSGDVIGLFLTERIPYVLPLAEVVARIRGQGGLVYVPHPFDPVRSSLGRVLPSLCAAGGVDVIEVFNAKIADPALNDKAAAGRGIPSPRHPLPAQFLTGLPAGLLPTGRSASPAARGGRRRRRGTARWTWPA
ncbi:MAG: PHP domain-containing protein [Trebonia sp.]